MPDKRRLVGKLTNPAAAIYYEPEATEERAANPSSHTKKLLEATQKTTEKMKMLFENTVSRMSGDGTEVSLGSLLQQVGPAMSGPFPLFYHLPCLISVQDAEEHLRVCPPCLVHLSRREQMMEQAQAPAIVEQYAMLDKLITEVASIAPNYVRMATSLK